MGGRAAVGKTPASTDLAIPSWELHIPFENLVGRPGRELFTQRVISIGGHFKPRDPRRQEKRPKDGAQRGPSPSRRGEQKGHGGKGDRTRQRTTGK